MVAIVIKVPSSVTILKGVRTRQIAFSYTAYTSDTEVINGRDCVRELIYNERVDMKVQGFVFSNGDIYYPTQEIKGGRSQPFWEYAEEQIGRYTSLPIDFFSNYRHPVCLRADYKSLV